MNLRNLALTSVLLAAAACTLPPAGQLPCKTVGATTSECPTGQQCGSDLLCRDLVTTCPDPVKQRQCGGDCVDITKDPFNCGGCGKACNPGEQCLADSAGNPKCTFYCVPGQTACAQITGGFVCETLASDRNNCGTCGNVCPTGKVCSNSACSTECAPGLSNCSGNCLDTTTDDANCGACNHACGAGTHCVNSQCTVICTPGQTECPAGSGNCVDTTKDRDNCGGCAVQCAAGQICVGSSCEVSCQAGLTLCNGSTCVNTTTDPNNCGGCGTHCAAGQVCTATGPGGSGVCTLQCPAGQSVCGLPTWAGVTAYFPGNEVTNGGSLYQAVTGGTSDVAGSGGPSGTGASIVDGTVTWQFQSAAPGGSSLCVNVQTDRNNCGACDDSGNSRACPAGEICAGGNCVVSCGAGLKLCNGTCVDTNNDPTNCGTCAHGCATDPNGPVCSSGSCSVSCPGTEQNCGGKCVDTTSDPANCGGCSPVNGGTGQVCAAGVQCVNSGCNTSVSCPSPSINCSNKCVNPQTDDANCGACTTAASGAGNHACPAGTSCQAGACQPTCDLSQGLFSCPTGSGGNACTDIQTDAANCGSCGHSCPAGQVCTSGGCACPSGEAECPAASGVCSNRANDAANCGACPGATCGNGSAYCVSGVCSAAPAGVQQNLSVAAVQADGWTQCYTEAYSSAGTTLAAIQTACPLGTQVMIACASGATPAALLVAASGPRATVFGGGTDAAGGVKWYAGGAFGFAPAGQTVTLAPCDVAGSAADNYAGGFGSQRMCWPFSSGTTLAAGARCGDLQGAGATTSIQRFVFTK